MKNGWVISRSEHCRSRKWCAFSSLLTKNAQCRWFTNVPLNHIRSTMRVRCPKSANQAQKIGCKRANCRSKESSNRYPYRCRVEMNPDNRIPRCGLRIWLRYIRCAKGLDRSFPSVRATKMATKCPYDDAGERVETQKETSTACGAPQMQPLRSKMLSELHELPVLQIVFALRNARPNAAALVTIAQVHECLMMRISSS